MQVIAVPSNQSEIDAFNQTLVDAATNGGRISLEPGVYPCNLELPNGTKGLILQGAGRDKTFLRSAIKNKPVIQCNGMWFSHLSDLSLGTNEVNEDNAVVDIDGSVNGHGHGIQGNTFDNLNVDGRGAFTGGMSDVAFAMCRVAQSAGQGDTNTFLNCHFFGAKKALVRIIGYNALNNQFIGGNCQLYEKNALEMVFGSFHIFGMAFQSTMGINQILNDGWDIRAEAGGVGDCLTINGCRTESLRFIKSNVAQPPLITNCNQGPAISFWYPNTFYRADTGVTRDGLLYRCVSEHTSGANPLDLNNSSLWELVDFNVVEGLIAALINNTWSMGNVSVYHDVLNPVMQVAHTSLEYGSGIVKEVPVGVKVVTVDASKGAVRLNLPTPAAVPIGTEIEVVRGDNPSMMVRTASTDPALVEYPVTIGSLYFNNEELHTVSLVTGGRILGRTSGVRVIRFRAIGGGSFPRRWYVI